MIIQIQSENKHLLVRMAIDLQMIGYIPGDDDTPFMDGYCWLHIAISTKRFVFWTFACALPILKGMVVTEKTYNETLEYIYDLTAM